MRTLSPHHLLRWPGPTAFVIICLTSRQGVELWLARPKVPLLSFAPIRPDFLMRRAVPHSRRQSWISVAAFMRPKGRRRFRSTTLMDILWITEATFDASQVNG